MTDYIKREDAIEAACMGCNDDFSNEPCEPSDCNIKRKIMKLPSADVVEVVRCKDCKHYRIWQMKCDRLHLVPIADHHYCSFGERAEE